MMEKNMIVIAVIGASTSVRARDSTKGWYMAALECLRTIGRWENKAGISAIVEIAAKRRELKRAKQYKNNIPYESKTTHKKRTPPREKKVEVLSLRRKKIVPTITACMMNELNPRLPISLSLTYKQTSPTPVQRLDPRWHP